MIIMVVCCIGCAVLFVGIGCWAERSKKPVHFWSGTSVEPDKVRDIRGYNHACAVMWWVYSIPYWLAGIASLLPPLEIISALLLVAASVPGSFVLIWWYLRIEKRYICK